MSIDINIPGYTLIREIGAGGMAKVYLGMQTLLERKVAIKILHQRLSAESDEFKKRFFTEGKVLAKLQHDNIVSIIDIGEADDMLYMAMEYVEGGTLTDWLKKQELTVDQAIQICSKTGLALHATHMQHIVHRDLKPSNILLRDIYTPLLTDFGIARQTDQDSGLTQTGHILGTLQYMSPEQIRGMHVDHRSDIYALGLMFYRLLVGRLPFVANSQYDLSRMQCEDPPPPLPEHLSDIQPVIDAMLAKDPEDRFQSCLEFCKAVSNLSVTNEAYADELEGATRIYDSSQLSAASFHSARHTGQFSERHSGQFSGQHSGQFTGQTGPQSGTYDQTRMMDSGQHKAGSGKLKKALLFGLPILAIVIAVSLYFAIWYVPSSGLSEANQRRLDNYLRRVDANLLKMQIDSPPEDNAIFELRRALALAPEYPPALDRAREIALFYETEAMDLMDANKPTEALDEVKKGLEIDPESVELVMLEEEIETMLAEQRRRAELNEALQVAAALMEQKQYIEPADNNALAAYNRVLELDPQNPKAISDKALILAFLIDQIDASIDAGMLPEAEQQVEVAMSLFQNSARLSSAQTRIEQEQARIKDQQEVEVFLASARQQMADNKLIEPEGDNALNSYREVLNRQDNEEAAAGLVQIASIYSERAQAAMDAGEFREAVTLADNGLLADPLNSALLKIQSDSTDQLGAADREIQSKLQLAQRLVNSGDFLPPGENAMDTFKQVEALDPGNAQAARGLSVLPDQVYEEANQQQRLGNLRGARDLLAIAETSFPGQSRFSELKAEMETAIAEQQKTERLEDMLESSGRLIATRPITLDVIDQSAKALKEISDEFPGNSTAAVQFTDLVSAINSRARQVSAGGNEDAGFVLLDRALDLFENNQQLQSTRNDLESIKQERLAEEARQLAATMGQLAIDAVPWGQVTGITDANGAAIELPANQSTPMLISLVAGSYTVSVADGEGNSSRNLTIDVIAQQVASTTAKFDSLTADEYFERSSW